MTFTPQIIHQTWKDAAIPTGYRDYVETWRRLHPDWQYRLWTDDDLLALVRTDFPALAGMFEEYPHAIMRADLGRYLILREFGGVYADLDSEALLPFDGFCGNPNPVFSYEPHSHTALEFVRNRGFCSVVSNAIAISPARHPFWDDLIDLLVRCRRASNPLDATGPFVLSAAIEKTTPAKAPTLLPAHVFAPRDKFGDAVAARGDVPAHAIHHWAGTWWKQPEAMSQSAAVQESAANTETLTFASSTKNPRGAGQTTASENHVLIAVPVRDAADTLGQLLTSILHLDYPRQKLSLAFFEGDSLDDSYAMLLRFQDTHGADFRRVQVFKEDSGIQIPQPRWNPAAQRIRRGNIARVRNAIVSRALLDEDWLLWIDSDIIGFSPDLIDTLLATGADIAHPNAVRRIGGQSIDQNAWITERAVSTEDSERWTLDGLYQPPSGYNRLYLSDVRYRDLVPLDSVGGTVLLVRADLHRAGLLFPEEPYRSLIETEGFARMSREHGVWAFGLPNVEVVHAAR